LAALRSSDTGTFLNHISSTGPHLWSLTSTACFSTPTPPLPVLLLPTGSGYFWAKTFPVQDLQQSTRDYSPDARFPVRGRIWQHALGGRSGVKSCASPAGNPTDCAAGSLKWSIFSTSTLWIFDSYLKHSLILDKLCCLTNISTTAQTDSALRYSLPCPTLFSPPLSACSGPEPHFPYCHSCHIVWHTFENPWGLPFAFRLSDGSVTYRLFRWGRLPVLMAGSTTPNTCIGTRGWARDVIMQMRSPARSLDRTPRLPLHTTPPLLPIFWTSC
jgi:hypothetical protein